MKHLADEKVIFDDKDARRAHRIVCHELMPIRCEAAGFSCEPCAPVSAVSLPDRCGSFATERRGEFRPCSATWKFRRRTYIPDRLRDFTAGRFSIRATASSYAPLRAAVPHADSCGEQNAATPSQGLHRHPQGVRQRRLHRGRGSGRRRRLDAATRAGLDRLPAAARSRAACMGRDRHRLGAPRGLMSARF